MTLLSLLILYICATAIAAPPTLPFLPLQSDVKNPDLNAPPLSVPTTLTSQLYPCIPSHLTHLTTNTFPQPSYPLHLDSVIGLITFTYPTYTSYPSFLLKIFTTTTITTRHQESTTLILDPLIYQEVHATLILYPSPALTWQAWKQAVEAMSLFNWQYWGVIYTFQIRIGGFDALVALGAIMTD